LEPAANSQTLEFSCLFAPDSPDVELPAFEETQNNNEHHWEEFWMSGGAVDFSDCTDPRAHELERRVVLSQYLTKVNGSGNYPHRKPD
jgi:protein-glucosylgalactosylhydroxylysine glucosidase